MDRRTFGTDSCPTCVRFGVTLEAGGGWPNTPPRVGSTPRVGSACVVGSNARVMRTAVLTHQAASSCALISSTFSLTYRPVPATKLT